ncbi:hypothetical protein GTW36_08745 [Vibrio parahaemolyticus]|nr:hypothetical protein [Vibrio parahaemolyticus]EGQ9049089.1 hypothetical protein [Vibrio parahaemolyticus]EGQ9145269.1 hypothetical protein [Vibrio parahaemolyticus]EGQ9588510.1 hypothetical protein [Vibrio parahaemolyticus]EGR1001908.1 hypothetical protein [Vibrio parahaemolyticus]
MFWDLKDRFDFDFFKSSCAWLFLQSFQPFFKKGLGQLIDTGSAYLEKLDDLCARVPSFEMSKG